LYWDDLPSAKALGYFQPGLYESANGRKFPRVQLLTIEGLLDKTQRTEHPDYEPDLNFKKTKTESNAEQKTLF